MYSDFVQEREVRQSREEAGVADNTLIDFSSDNGGRVHRAAVTP